MLRTSLLLLVLLVSAASSAQAQVSIPNTFTHGTPALASEVNQNFQALASAVNSSGCATPDDVVCNPASVSCPACPSCPAAPACDELGSYLQGQISGAGGGSDVSYLIVLCENAGGTWDTGMSTCSVDITVSADAVDAAGTAACLQAGGAWDAGTSTCTPAYNCFVGGYCAQAAIVYPLQNSVGEPLFPNVHDELTHPRDARCTVPGEPGPSGNGIGQWNEGVAFFTAVAPPFFQSMGLTHQFTVFMCQ
jgi:hypothetical protein